MDPSKLSSQDLLRLCLQAKDESLWLEFVRRFQPLIARIVVKSIRRWTMPTPALADDLVQETYLKLCANDFRALRQFDCQHENALFAFLKVIASNVVQDHFRSSYSQKRGSGKQEEDIETVSVGGTANSNFTAAAERKILIAEIGRCLESQADEANFPRDRTIFWLYYQQGLTAKAISQLPGMDLTVKGVESTLLRLTRLLRERMNTGTAGMAKQSGSRQITASGG